MSHQNDVENVDIVHNHRANRLKNDRNRWQVMEPMNPLKSVNMSFQFPRNDFVFVFDLDNPSARIQFLLGDEDQDEDDEEHKPHDLFIELSELISEKEKVHESGDLMEQGWKETARSMTFSCFIHPILGFFFLMN